MLRAAAIIVALASAALILLSAVVARPSAAGPMPQLTQTPLATRSPTMAAYLPVIGNPPTPTVQPTVAPSVVVLGNSSAFVGDGGRVYIVGEVDNQTSNTITFVSVAIWLLDAQGQEISASIAYVQRLNMRPSSVACFRGFFTITEGWASYRLGEVTYRNSSARVPNVALINAQGTRDSSGYTISGSVRNLESTPVESVAVAGTLYNAAGMVLDCEWNYADDATLAPDQQTGFVLPLTSRRSYAEVARFHAETDGLLP
jgi:hypothetical protein